jgi:hypothetical protein
VKGDFSVGTEDGSEGLLGVQGMLGTCWVRPLCGIDGVQLRLFPLAIVSMFKDE